MPSHFQTAMMIGNAVQHMIDTKKIIKVSYSDNRENGSTLASEFGWEVLGQGHFSSVYANPHDPDTVFKVGINKAGKGIDAWVDYAAFCMQHYAENEHLLKVYEIAVFPDCFVSIMERLDILDTKQRLMAVAAGSSMWSDASTEKYRDNPEFGSLFNTCTMIGDRVGMDDLHGANAMRRGNVIVITDPVCSRTGRFQYEEYLNGHRVGTERAVLAEGRANPAVRAEAEDQVLRERPVNDRVARKSRVYGALLPQSRPRGLRAASENADDARARAKAERHAAAFGGRLDSFSAARRLELDIRDRTTRREAMDAARRHQLGPQFFIRDSVLREVQACFHSAVQADTGSIETRPTRLDSPVSTRGEAKVSVKDDRPEFLFPFQQRIKDWIG